MSRIDEICAPLAAGNIYHHEYHPRILLYGNTVYDSSAKTLIQIMGHSQVGKTTTTNKAVELSAGKLVKVAFDSIVFDTQKKTTVLGTTEYNHFPLTTLIILTSKTNRTVIFDQMTLGIQYCIDELSLIPRYLEVIENDIDATAQALLNLLFVPSD